MCKLVRRNAIVIVIEITMIGARAFDELIMILAPVPNIYIKLWYMLELCVENVKKIASFFCYHRNTSETVGECDTLYVAEY